MPLVSILLPTLNSLRFLDERIKSIQLQTHQDWELICCDSYSDDGTWEYLQTMRGDPRVRLYQVPREGLYAGWNECLRRAKGRYAYIATADDTMADNCLSRLSESLERNPGVDLVQCRVDWIDDYGKLVEHVEPEILRFLRPHLGEHTLISSDAMFLMLAGFSWGLGSVTGLLFRRSLLERTGLFPTDLSFLGDAEWTLRASLATDLLWVGSTWSTWRIRDGQASRRFRLQESWLFRLALYRVLADPNSGIPSHWSTTAGWREQLLGPRSAQLEMATKLVWSTFSAHWMNWPKWCWEAWQVSPQLLLRRLFAAFSPRREWERHAEDFVTEWLIQYQVPWPPKQL